MCVCIYQMNQLGSPHVFYFFISNNAILFQVRASAVFALGTLLDVGFDSTREGTGDEDCDDDDEKIKAEISVIKSLLNVVSDGSPLVRAEVAVGM